MADNIFTLSGWGFTHTVFQHSAAFQFPYTPLCYGSDEPLNLMQVTHSLSQQLSDDSTLIGWSLGGLIAISLAIHYPSKVKKLILIASQARFLEEHNWVGISIENAQKFLTQSTTDIRKCLHQFSTLVNFPNRIKEIKDTLSTHLNDFNTTVLQNQLAILFNTDLRAEYQKLTLPILHILNDRDVILRQSKDTLKKLQPNANIATVANAGHAGILSHPEEYQSILNEFINAR